MKSNKEQEQKQEELHKQNQTKKYNTVRTALKEACLQGGVLFDNVFSKYSENLCDDLNSKEIAAIVDEIEEIIIQIIDNCFISDWDETIETCFEDDNKGAIFHLIHNTIKGDPANVFLSFSKINEELKKIRNNKKLEVLMDLEEFSSKNSLEDVTNTYGLMFYSIYGNEVTEACLNGFNKNKHVNQTHISAYFRANGYNSRVEIGKGERDVI